MNIIYIIVVSLFFQMAIGAADQGLFKDQLYENMPANSSIFEERMTKESASALEKEMEKMLKAKTPKTDKIVGKEYASCFLFDILEFHFTCDRDFRDIPRYWREEVKKEANDFFHEKLRYLYGERPSLPDKEEKELLIKTRSTVFEKLIKDRRNIELKCSAIILPQEKVNEYIKIKAKFDELRSNPSAKSIDTDNSMGSIMNYSNLLIREYEDYVRKIIHEKGFTNLSTFCHNSKAKGLVKENTNVLDIGTGTGLNSQFVTEAAVLVANDLHLGHLIKFLMRLTRKELNNVYLNNGPFPDQMEQPNDMFDAIILSYVLHYLSGPKIRVGLKKTFNWLERDRRAFIQVLSPYYHSSASGSSLINTLEKRHSASQQDQSIEWPGYIEGQSIHFIHPSILERELKAAGFEIEYINYGYYNTTTRSPISYEDHEYYVTRNGLSTSLPKDERAEKIEKILKDTQMNKLLELMKADRQKYSYKNDPNSPFWYYNKKYLETLQVVMAIARKN